MKSIGKWLVVGSLCVGTAYGATFEESYQQGKARLEQEQYGLAVIELNEAQQLALTPEDKAKSAGILGLTYYRMQRWEPATKLLREATSFNVGENADRARWLGTLADLEADKGQLEIARPLYKKALSLVGTNPELVAGLKLGEIETLPLDEKLSELNQVKGNLEQVENTETRARLLINLGTQAHKVGKEGFELAFECFEQANKLTANSRLKAEALGQLSQLYEEQNRFSEALKLNTQAIAEAKKVEAHDLLLELEWRQGRLNRSSQKLPEATLAYQNAIQHIEAIRQDIPVEYHNGRSSFREILEPVYLGLADLLLMQASQKSGAEKTLLLRQARETVELIKQSELEDFLGGRCSVHTNKNSLDSVEASTAIIYPILLPERLELLVSSGSEIRQYTQPIDAATLQELTKHLAHSLRTSKYDVKKTANQLYQWLIAPVEPWLKQQNIKTLVMVPDGVLRLIPPAVLYDGQHYLIEKYAIATSPGLTLFEPAPLQKRGIKALLAGMSEPGAVIENLPTAFLQSITGTSSARGGNPSDMSEAAVKSRKLELERMIKEPVFRQQLKEKLSLPGVAEEIKSLQKEIPNSSIMNESFTVEAFKKQAVQEPYSIVHIASHGVFGKTADTSFVMAYDGVINMDELEQLLKSDKFAKQPVELLTLSACQTAEGDDRAPLGLSGVALKAKVRSALGTLWPVSDEAASLLMAEFYKVLAQPNMSKVEALRQAQISLLKQKELENPVYWSPFILAGSWL
jgi:CHAT domain-containing protein